MPPERDLEKLLRRMKPVLQDGVFVFCTQLPGRALPAGLKPLLLFREAEGLTMVVRLEEAEAAGLAYQYKCRQITLTVHSSLNAVGFIAAVATRLAALGISVNPVSGYYHDHLFVPEDRAAAAMHLLAGFGKG